MAHAQPIFLDQVVAVIADEARVRALTELLWVTPVEVLVTHLAFSRPKSQSEIFKG